MDKNAAYKDELINGKFGWIKGYANSRIKGS
jgi:hypothetical protein